MRIKLPQIQSYAFRCVITVRIDDINYGNHVSNDAYLKYMHEARMQFFAHYGLSEMNIGGVSVIMGDTAIVYKKECFYGQVLNIDVVAADFGARSFNIYYKFSDHLDEALVAEAKTGMVCFDYTTHKTVPIPTSFIQLFTQSNDIS